MYSQPMSQNILYKKNETFTKIIECTSLGIYKHVYIIVLEIIPSDNSGVADFHCRCTIYSC